MGISRNLIEDIAKEWLDELVDSWRTNTVTRNIITACVATIYYQYI